ncbi:hypothetical protein E2C01_080182 [Portunus trituberculatus]|uniref:Uncharacterized protein n=1 Tax=Portunus trituberculatus TaxID=210409 RepID=A0A5B7ILI0_PORTR|nr:hypothetical protein [Portunus trituberculatus]
MEGDTIWNDLEGGTGLTDLAWLGLARLIPMSTVATWAIKKDLNKKTHLVASSRAVSRELAKRKG